MLRNHREKSIRRITQINVGRCLVKQWKNVDSRKCIDGVVQRKHLDIIQSIGWNRTEQETANDDAIFLERKSMSRESSQPSGSHCYFADDHGVARVEHYLRMEKSVRILPSRVRWFRSTWDHRPGQSQEAPNQRRPYAAMYSAGQGRISVQRVRFIPDYLCCSLAKLISPGQTMKLFRRWLTTAS